jgi:hypothetical protein
MGSAYFVVTRRSSPTRVLNYVALAGSVGIGKRSGS